MPGVGQVTMPRPSWFILTGLPQESGTRTGPISQGKVELLTSVHVAGWGLAGWQGFEPRPSGPLGRGWCGREAGYG